MRLCRRVSTGKAASQGTQTPSQPRRAAPPPPTRHHTPPPPHPGALLHHHTPLPRQLTHLPRRRTHLPPHSTPPEEHRTPQPPQARRARLTRFIRAGRSNSSGGLGQSRGGYHPSPLWRLGFSEATARPPLPLQTPPKRLGTPMRTPLPHARLLPACPKTRPGRTTRSAGPWTLRPDWAPTPQTGARHRPRARVPLCRASESGGGTTPLARPGLWTAPDRHTPQGPPSRDPSSPRRANTGGRKGGRKPPGARCSAAGPTGIRESKCADRHP